jgi:TonB family protein
MRKCGTDALYCRGSRTRRPWRLAEFPAIEQWGYLMKTHQEGRGVSTVVSSATRLVALLIAIALIYPLRGVADEPLSTVSEQQILPPIKSSKGFYYPDAAKRVGLEGKVLVAFDIGADGRVANLAMLFSDESAFENTAKEYMSGLRFEVPSNWASSAGRYQRYHIGFVFCIPPSDLVGTFGIAASPVTISTNRISGSPIRNPPAAGATGTCVSYQTAKH